MIILFVILLVLILLNSLFSMMEFSSISVRKEKLSVLAQEGNIKARKVLHLISNIANLLSASQLGITFCSILIGGFGDMLAETLTKKITSTYSVLISIFVMVILIFAHLIFGEILPKNIAISNGENAAILLSSFSAITLKLFTPLVKFFNWLTEKFLRMFGLQLVSGKYSRVTGQELKVMIGDSFTQGLLDNEEHERLLKAINVSENNIANVVIPNESVRSIVVDNNFSLPKVEQIEKAVLETGFSRFPITLKNGNYIGFIHVKDILGELPYYEVTSDLNSNNKEISRRMIHSLPILPMETKLSEAISVMTKLRTHIAQVISQGRIIGIVALEDLAEEFVGTVRDETHKM